MTHVSSARLLHDRLRRSLWFTPTVMTACSFALLALLLQLDQLIDTPPAPLGFSGDPDVAREVASVIAGSIMGFIGIVFSITIVALQLASSQYSPRALRGFLRDRLTKVTLGAFVSTFAYALLTIRYVDDAETEVPNLTVAGLFLLTFICVALFIAYIHNVAQSIRVVRILDTVLDETIGAIEHLLPRELDARDADLAPVTSDDPVLVRHVGRGGVLVSVDARELIALGQRTGGIVELRVTPGDFVRRGGPVARVHGGSQADCDVTGALRFDSERSLAGEVSYGIRQLVDIALRALSPGINDPTTATQAVDRIHELLGMLLHRDAPDPWIVDDDGVRRAWVRSTPWEDYVALALDELRLAGRGHLQLHRRLLHLLDELLEAAPAHRRAPLQERRAALLRTVPGAFDDERDERAASIPDARGIG